MNKAATTGKKRITPMRFQMAASTYLDGINLGQVLSTIRLSADDDGNIKEHVVSNIKKSLNVAIKTADNEIVKSKCRLLQKFMEDYI